MGLRLIQKGEGFRWKNPQSREQTREIDWAIRVFQARSANRHLIK
jgi:hypothetical protein